MDDRKREVLAFGILFSIIGFLVLTSYVIQGSTSYTFSSKATDTSQSSVPESFNQTADELIDFSKNQLPHCIEEVSYFSSEDMRACQIHFSCTESADINYIKDTDIRCSESEGSFWCNDDSVNAPCNTLGTWIGIFEKVCGCE